MWNQAQLQKPPQPKYCTFTVTCMAACLLRSKNMGLVSPKALEASSNNIDHASSPAMQQGGSCLVKEAIFQNPLQATVRKRMDWTGQTFALLQYCYSQVLISKIRKIRQTQNQNPKPQKQPQLKGIRNMPLFKSNGIQNPSNVTVRDI